MASVTRLRWPRTALDAVYCARGRGALQEPTGLLRLGVCYCNAKLSDRRPEPPPSPPRAAFKWFPGCIRSWDLFFVLTRLHCVICTILHCYHQPIPPHERHLYRATRHNDTLELSFRAVAACHSTACRNGQRTARWTRLRLHGLRLVLRRYIWLLHQRSNGADGTSNCSRRTASEQR